MKKHNQSFTKGISQDISSTKYPNNNIYWAQNFRLLNKEGLSGGALSNIKGTVPKLDVGAGRSINGSCLIRDKLILFVYTAEGGKIYLWNHNNTDVEESLTPIYENADLNFQEDVPIIAIGKYETPTVQKIYFTDGTTFFKCLNIVNPDWEGENDEINPQFTTLSYDIDSIDLVPNITYSDIDLEIQSGGNLKAGKIQYAYQFYNKRGTESSISAESDFVTLVNASETASSTLNYKGDEVGTNINKSINVTINNTDVLFERIRLFALEYETYNQVPNIRIVGEYDLGNTDTTMLDSGQSIGALTLEEFRVIQHNFYPKTMDEKDNMLFVANIKEEYFKLTHDEFDARAFRFNVVNSCIVKDNTDSYSITYTGGVLSTLPDEDHEAYNNFNNVHTPYNSETNKTSLVYALEQAFYKYNPSTGNLGGYGKNISYSFITNPVVLDEGSYSERGYIGSYPSITCEVGNRENYTNPLLQAGYQRDEVYRFAFVPIDTKGREGFAMWIGDIKFPSNIELPFITYIDNKTYANVLGIEFTVNIPEGIKDKISGYKIVRTNRTSVDKTIVAQGLIGYLANGGPDSSDKDHMMSQASIPLVNDMYNESPSYSRRTQNLTLAGDDNNPSGDDEYTRKSSEDLPIEDDGEPGFNPKFIEFTSPEVAFNKQTFESSEAFIEAFGTLEENDYTAMSGPQWRDAEDRNQLVSDKFKDFSTGNNNKRTRAFLKDNKIYSARNFKGASSDPDNDVTLHTVDGGRKFNNKTSNLVNTGGGDYRRYGLRGVFNLCTVDDGDDIDANKLPLGEFYDGTNDFKAVLANYKINKGKSQYGGSSFEARSYNVYQAASKYVDKDTTTVEVYNGDTYINFFAYARSLWGTAEADAGDTIESFVFFPVESSINLDLRLDNIQKYINWGWYGINDKFGSPDYKIAETLQQGVLTYGSSYPQDLGDLYRYNSAYSAQTKGKEYVPEPFDFKDEEFNDTRISNSQAKTNGEYIDSWTKFKFNNYLDVNSEYDAITRIITFKNQLYCFQATAIGVAAVNQRSLVQDEQSGKLTVGNGGILNRFDYITDKSGTEFYEGIAVSDVNLFYCDSRRKRIYKLISGKESAVSVIKGIDSTLDKLDWTNVRTGFNRKFNEVVFAIDNMTLGFSEIADAFISGYSYTPKLMISIKNDFFSVSEQYYKTPLLFGDFDFDVVGYSGESDEDDDWDYITIGNEGVGDTLYKHDVGDYGSFYGSDDIQDSYLTLIINPENNNICYFDNLDLRTESTADGIDDPDNVFYKLTASNSYQTITRDLAFTMDNVDANKGYTYNAGTIKRIGRLWRTPIMGIPETWAQTTPRMIDTYLKLKLEYANTGNAFKVQDIQVYYRKANY